MISHAGPPTGLYFMGTTMARTLLRGPVERQHAKVRKCRTRQLRMRTLSIWYGTKASIYTWNGWQKADGNAVGEADDDVPLQLKQNTIAAENKGGES